MSMDAEERGKISVCNEMGVSADFNKIGAALYSPLMCHRMSQWFLLLN
jgi:hypothetical protein